jgi:acyl-CoA thioester hydrolase
MSEPGEAQARRARRRAIERGGRSGASCEGEPHRVGETFRFPVRVYYEDTDAAGVVYYANYLKFMERARTEWLSALGFDLAAIERQHGIVFVVHRVEVDFRAPAQLSDRLDVSMTLTELGRARMRADQDICRGNEILTQARVALACINASTRRPARIPAPLFARMESLL